jgi:hypothetical protein
MLFFLGQGEVQINDLVGGKVKLLQSRLNQFFGQIISVKVYRFDRHIHRKTSRDTDQRS